MGFAALPRGTLRACYGSHGSGPAAGATEGSGVGRLRWGQGAACALGLLLPACTTLRPSDLDAEPPRISTSFRGPVEVASVHQPMPRARFHANGLTFDVDLDALSDRLAELLRESLQQAGVATQAGTQGGATSGAKRLGIQVVYLDFPVRGPCLLDYTVTLGAGPPAPQRFGLQAAGDATGYLRACRKAFAAAVSQVVEDPRTRRYLGAPEAP